MEIDAKTKKSLATLVIILIAALGIRFVFAMGVQKKRVISSRVQETNEKINLLNSITALNKDVSGYEKALSRKISQSALTDTIANLSKGLVIKVLSVTPQPKDDYGEYVKLNTKLELEGSYAEVMQFLKRLESDELFIKVELLEIKSSYSRASRWGGVYDVGQSSARRIEEALPQVSMAISTLYKK